MLNKSWIWFVQTSTIVGVPVTIVILLIAMERSFATLTCETARIGCDRSFTQSVDYIAEQVDANTDVIVTPKKRR
jgi:hypothetical protein